MSKGIADEIQGLDKFTTLPPQESKLQSFLQGYLHHGFRKALVGPSMTSLFVVPLAGALATENEFAILNAVQPSLISGVVLGVSAVLLAAHDSQEPHLYTTHKPSKNFGKATSLAFPIAVSLGVGALAINNQINDVVKTEPTGSAITMQKPSDAARDYLQKTASVTYTIPMIK